MRRLDAAFVGAQRMLCPACRPRDYAGRLIFVFRVWIFFLGICGLFQGRITCGCRGLSIGNALGISSRSQRQTNAAAARNTLQARAEILHLPGYQVAPATEQGCRLPGGSKQITFAEEYDENLLCG